MRFCWEAAGHLSEVEGSEPASSIQGKERLENAGGVKMSKETKCHYTVLVFLNDTFQEKYLF